VPKNALDLLAVDERRSQVAAGIFAIEKRGDPISNLTNPQPWLLNHLSLPTKSGAAVSDNTALGIGTVWACAQIISGLLSRLPINLVQETAAGDVEVKDHPAVRLLSVTPDGVRTSFAWRQMMNVAALLRGNGLSRIRRDRKFQLLGIDYLNPNETQFRTTTDGDPIYTFRGQLIPPHEIFHHRDMTRDGVTGLSLVACLREELGMAITTQEHGARFFANGATPGVVLSAPLTATKEQMDRIRSELEKNHGGVANANKPFVAYGGLTVSPIQISNQDAQFLESRKFDVEAVARAFRVPKHLVQSSEGTTSWGTGIEGLNRGFFDFGLADRVRAWEQELTFSLLTTSEQNEGLRFKFDLHDLLSGSAADRAAYYQIMRNICAMSVNEVRRKEGLRELPDNIGDDYRLTFNGSGGTPKNGAQQDSKSGSNQQKQEAEK
jgi:HK97 family phage portal protein